MSKNNYKKEIKTIIFTTEDLPFNSPGAKRIFNLFDRGIMNPSDSFLICLGRAERGHKEFKKFKEVKFIDSILIKENTLSKILYTPYSFFLLLINLIYIFKKYNFKNSYIYSRLGIYTLPVVLISKLYKTDVYIDCTEWFLIKEMGGFFNVVQELFHRYFSMKFAESFYAISNNMMDLLKNKYPEKIFICFIQEFQLIQKN